MANSPSSAIAQALDERIRAIVEDVVQEALESSISEIVRVELAAAIGGGAAATTARRGRTAAKATTRKTTKAAAKKTTAKKPATGKRTAAASTAAKRTCNVVGCERPYRSQGYCAAHYQAARKYGWPMPATPNFVAPPRPARGRPPKK